MEIYVAAKMRQEQYNCQYINKFVTLTSLEISANNTPPFGNLTDIAVILWNESNSPNELQIWTVAPESKIHSTVSLVARLVNAHVPSTDVELQIFGSHCDHVVNLPSENQISAAMQVGSYILH